MRVIVFFDLPNETNEDKKEYRKFRKFLITSGFIMLQESVYCKLVQNDVAAESVSLNVRRHKPAKGQVQLLRITEKQFSRIEYITGEKKTDILDTTDKLVIL